MKNRRGEIATLLTIGTIVVIGVAAIASSFNVNKQQSTSTRASGCTAGVQVGTSSFYKCAANCGALANGTCLKYEHNSPDKTCAPCNVAPPTTTCKKTSETCTGTAGQQGDCCANLKCNSNKKCEAASTCTPTCGGNTNGTCCGSNETCKNVTGNIWACQTSGTCTETCSTVGNSSGVCCNGKACQYQSGGSGGWACQTPSSCVDTCSTVKSPSGTCCNSKLTCQYDSNSGTGWSCRTPPAVSPSPPPTNTCSSGQKYTGGANSWNTQTCEAICGTNNGTYVGAAQQGQDGDRRWCCCSVSSANSICPQAGLGYACCVQDDYVCPSGESRYRWYGCTGQVCSATKITTRGGPGHLVDCPVGVNQGNQESCSGALEKKLTLPGTSCKDWGNYSLAGGCLEKCGTDGECKASIDDPKSEKRFCCAKSSSTMCTTDKGHTIKYDQHSHCVSDVNYTLCQKQADGTYWAEEQTCRDNKVCQEGKGSTTLDAGCVDIGTVSPPAGGTPTCTDAGKVNCGSPSSVCGTTGNKNLYYFLYSANNYAEMRGTTCTKVTEQDIKNDCNCPNATTPLQCTFADFKLEVGKQICKNNIEYKCTNTGITTTVATPSQTPCKTGLACETGENPQKCVDMSNLGQNACRDAGGARTECGKFIGTVVKTQACTNYGGYPGTSSYSIVCSTAAPWQCQYYIKHEIVNGAAWDKETPYYSVDTARERTFCERTGGAGGTGTASSFGVSLTANNLNEIFNFGGSLISGSICTAGTDVTNQNCTAIPVASWKANSETAHITLTVKPGDTIRWISGYFYDNKGHTYSVNQRVNIDDNSAPQAGGYGLVIDGGNPIK